VTYFAALAIAVGFGLPLAVLSAAYAQSRAASAALEGMARQPEIAGRLQTAMIISLALIESLVIYCLVMAVLLWIKMPTNAQVVFDALSKGAR
jgi:F-type H+-transporting ATPase subunit c